MYQLTKTEMPKGVYHRSEKAKDHARTVNIGRVPWNKGKSGLQTAWNKGKMHGKVVGSNNGNWKGGISNREVRAGREVREHCEVCYSHGVVDFDHDHKTGKFRGWLCRRCNLVLGMVKDNRHLLGNLALYLDISDEETNPKNIFHGLLPTDHSNPKDTEAI